MQLRSVIVGRYNKDPNWPDIQVVLIPTGSNSDGGLFDRVGNGIKEDAYDRVYGNYLNNYSFAISPVFSRPFSRGSIQLKDNNPFSAPLIYAPYYNDPRDMKYMVISKFYQIQPYQNVEN